MSLASGDSGLNIHHSAYSIFFLFNFGINSVFKNSRYNLVSWCLKGSLHLLQDSEKEKKDKLLIICKIEFSKCESKVLFYLLKCFSSVFAMYTHCSR